MRKEDMKKKEDFERKERFKKIDKKKEQLRSKTVQTKIIFGLKNLGEAGRQEWNEELKRKRERI